jgi:plasmid stability protein
MANLSIRKLSEATVQSLRIRAARHGVSMEEEVRQILDAAVRPPQPVGDMAVALFADVPPGEDIELPEREQSEPIRL